MGNVTAALAAGLVVFGLAGTAPVQTRAAPADALRAVDVDPPGESGLTTLAGFVTGTTGLGSFGAHTTDQLGLYTSWQYKSMQFERTGGPTVPGDASVRVGRDSYGVPTVTAASEPDLFYGVGYAMAQDRLFELEAFRHAGHGTLASLIGATGLAIDEQVRRYDESPPALAAQFAQLPASTRTDFARFTDGINAEIRAVDVDPLQMPAELVLLDDVPMAPWTIGDTLAFADYSLRSYGEFGHGEVDALSTYLSLVQRLGQSAAERVFESLYPLDDPSAPTTITTAFPRHSGSPVTTGFGGSVYANHDPSLFPSLAEVKAASNSSSAGVVGAATLLGLPKLGSNSIALSGTRTSTGAPMLYGGPEAGFAIPNSLWEVEVHDPERDERGVMIPGIPLMIIGRSATTGWTITSGLDVDASTYVETLNASDTASLHDGTWVPVTRRTVTIDCRDTLIGVKDFLLTLPTTTALCPAEPVTFPVYETMHGVSIASPDPTHHLFVRDSAIDGTVVASLASWDGVGLARTPAQLTAAVNGVGLSLNFTWIETAGDVAYMHAGRYPILPSNADPTLPLPGTGGYDWEGFERPAALPHVVDPASGMVVNWNNKPAPGWWSPPLGVDGPEESWGPAWEVAPLQADVAAAGNVDFEAMGQLPRDVAYTDTPALMFVPPLETALAGTTNAELAKVRAILESWSFQRDASPAGTGYASPAVVFSDYFVARLVLDTLTPLLGADAPAVAGLACASTPCVYHSIDNQDAPSYKFELSAEQATLRALTGADTTLLDGRTVTAVLLQAATEAAGELSASQGANPSAWNEAVETGSWAPQGVITAQPLVPLPNRGSFAEVIGA